MMGQVTLTGPSTNLQFGFIKAFEQNGTLQPGEYQLTAWDVATPSAPQSCKDGSYSFTFQVFHACFADCDQSGSLDINDFVCFQTLFATGDPAADCDGSETLNIDDFICFQTSFVLGC
jgi:hypothetical protein